ncbi:MAG: hypothetical protein GY880_01750, partial [Planctomycetaceae bacterium]|nr:hypothetical protein [Planctomycetaceae bacterium]
MHIDPVLAKEAWRIALSRQPLAGVKPEKVKRRWHWGAKSQTNERGSTGSFNHHEAESSPEPWNFEDDELRLTISSHLEMRTGGRARPTGELHGKLVERTTLVYFAVHHAISDGAGAILVVNEWLAIYANLESGRSGTAGLQRLEADRLRARNHLGLFRWNYLKHIFQQPVALFGATKFIFRKTVDLTIQKDVSDGDARLYPAIVGRWLDAEAVRCLGRESGRLRV